jgi:hypothetical protein
MVQPEGVKNLGVLFADEQLEVFALSQLLEVQYTVQKQHYLFDSLANAILVLSLDVSGLLQRGNI